MNEVIHRRITRTITYMYMYVLKNSKSFRYRNHQLVESNEREKM